MEPTEVGAILLFVILGVTVIAVAIASIRSLRRIPAPSATKPPEKWRIGEVKPDSKYILIYNGKLTELEKARLHEVFAEWWNEDRPLIVLSGADMMGEES